MTPNERVVLTYLCKKSQATASQIQNQCCITSGALATIMRSLKTKLLVEQDGRYYRATQATAQALQSQPAPQPFAGQPAW